MNSVLSLVPKYSLLSIQEETFYTDKSIHVNLPVGGPLVLAKVVSINNPVNAMHG